MGGGSESGTGRTSINESSFVATSDKRELNTLLSLLDIRSRGESAPKLEGTAVLEACPASGGPLQSRCRDGGRSFDGSQ